MTDSSQTKEEQNERIRPQGDEFNVGRQRHRRLQRGVAWSSGIAVVFIVAGGWLGFRASEIKSEIDSAYQLIPHIKDSITANNAREAAESVRQLRSHTASAREASEDPIWTLAAAVPFIGTNFSAVSEVARSADDVSTLGVAPLVSVFESLNWDTLMPNSKGTDLAPLEAASPKVSSAAHAVRVSAARLERIDTSNLLPQVAEPLIRARGQLEAVTGALDASADAAKIAPAMLGAQGTRKYLLMIQNNAEVRASGGIPGALAVLTLDHAKLTLGAQSSAGAVGYMTPTLTVDPEQQQIYSGRLGKFMQDVNLTPDFPTTASTAQAMWERKTGQRVDGVISMDPIVLGYILDGTGPIKVGKPELLSLASGLPVQLTGKNVVKTLLSDVYAKIEQPELQDAYFAGVAQEIFSTLGSGKGDAKSVLEGITRGTTEGRVLVWSAKNDEQSVLAEYPLSGSIEGPSVAPAQFGVYFNDGTGAKMDYYVKRTVQLVEECTEDGYSQVRVRVTSTNNAPADAATSLPEYVTGGGAFGVPAGSVQTNIVAYGPMQSNVEEASVAGKKTAFSAQRHAGRPVGTVTVRLAPGQSSTVEFTFGKIVQHTDPVVGVTPTVEALKDVVLETKAATCVPPA
ncbi:UNVERIFIED_ORG: hypothetical protein J2X79_002519 [Arthrobacter globiformis]|nr:hypothetical protein [Arthrobacter globiformis]